MSKMPIRGCPFITWITNDVTCIGVVQCELVGTQSSIKYVSPGDEGWVSVSKSEKSTLDASHRRTVDLRNARLYDFYWISWHCEYVRDHVPIQQLLGVLWFAREFANYQPICGWYLAVRRLLDHVAAFGCVMLLALHDSWHFGQFNYHYCVAGV